MIKISIGSSLSLPAHGRAGARATSLSFCISVPPPKKNRAKPESMRAKRKGVWGKEFLPACQSAEGGMGRESVSAIPALAGRQNRKIFISLIEKNFRRARLKNVKKIFLFCSPSGERKRWAGQSAKSSGFCSKKVLTSSSRHHFKNPQRLGIFDFNLCLTENYTFCPIVQKV